MFSGTTSCFRFNCDFRDFSVLCVPFYYIKFPLASFYELLIKPPWDLETGKKFIIHYTYGCDYNLKVKWLFFYSHF